MSWVDVWRWKLTFKSIRRVNATKRWWKFVPCTWACSRGGPVSERRYSLLPSLHTLACPRHCGWTSTQGSGQSTSSRQLIYTNTRLLLLAVLGHESMHRSHIARSSWAVLHLDTSSKFVMWMGGAWCIVPFRHSQQGKWPIGLQRPGPTELIIQPRPCPSFQHTLESLGGWSYGPNRLSWPTGLIKPCPSLIR